MDSMCKCYIFLNLACISSGNLIFNLYFRMTNKSNLTNLLNLFFTDKMGGPWSCIYG